VLGHEGAVPQDVEELETLFDEVCSHEPTTVTPRRVLFAAHENHRSIVFRVRNISPEETFHTDPVGVPNSDLLVVGATGCQKSRIFGHATKFTPFPAIGNPLQWESLSESHPVELRVVETERFATHIEHVPDPVLPETLDQVLKRLVAVTDGVDAFHRQPE
jgi:hypothetical protein